MGVGYELINTTKKEKITFHHLPVYKMHEIVGNPVSSAIVTWYLLKNSGDEIGFVPDQYYDEDWPFNNVTWDDIYNFRDLTEEIIVELIDNKILIDNGRDYLYEDEPELYMRRLKNIFLD